MAAPLMSTFNKGRLRRCSSPQPRYGLSVLEQHLQILLRGGDWSNIEVLHKVVQHIGRNERRQRGAKSNILDPQTQQRQQNAHCLLLVLPRRAEVALEMGIFFQFRIAMGGQHFAVGVDVDALPAVCSSSSLRSCRSCPEMTMNGPFSKALLNSRSLMPNSACHQL